MCRREEAPEWYGPDHDDGASDSETAAQEMSRVQWLGRVNARLRRAPHASLSRKKGRARAGTAPPDSRRTALAGGRLATQAPAAAAECLANHRWRHVSCGSLLGGGVRGGCGGCEPSMFTLRSLSLRHI